MQRLDLAGGYCAFNSEKEIECEIFKKGYQAIKKIAYQGRHPTGYFFNNSLLKSIKLIERFSDYEFVDLFPLEFVFAELCSMGNGAVYHQRIFTPETGEMVVKHKSSTTNGVSKKAFFSPESRLKLAINYAFHINSLQLTRREKKLLTIDMFINGLLAATIGYRAILRNKGLCTHYYMEPRNIEKKELVEIGLNFYKQFLTKTNALRGRKFINKVEFSWHVFFNIFHKGLNLLSKKLVKY